MITWQAYTVSKEGKLSLSIALPCFCAAEADEKKEKADFEAAARMNRFYSRAMDILYPYALSFLSEDLRRGTFLCTADTSADESDVITVQLHMTLRLFYQSKDRRTLQHAVTHRWKNGVLLRRKKKEP